MKKPLRNIRRGFLVPFFNVQLPWLPDRSAGGVGR